MSGPDCTWGRDTHSQPAWPRSTNPPSTNTLLHNLSGIPPLDRTMIRTLLPLPLLPLLVLLLLLRPVLSLPGAINLQ